MAKLSTTPSQQLSSTPLMTLQTFLSQFEGETDSNGRTWNRQLLTDLHRNYNGGRTSNTTNPRGDDGNKGGSTAGKVTLTLAEAIKTQEVDYGNRIEDSSIKASEIISSFVDKSTKTMLGPTELLSKLTESAGKKVGEFLQEQTQLLHAINEGTSLTGKLSEGVREELTLSNSELTKYGINLNDVVDSSLSLTASTSKFNFINAESWDKIAQSALAYVGTLSSLTTMLPEFEKIGYGATDTAKQIQVSGQRMMKLGLDSKSMLKDMQKDIGKLNEYGFKDGIQGLANMVTKSKEFRMEMESTFTIANKVMDPEGAIDMAANLQAIGGAIGDLGDPLKMMYMATNNVEGIQDALIGASQSLATFNKEGGRFEVTGVNLRKAKAMADQMGISMGELTKGAIAAAERTSAATSMLSNGLKLDKDQTDLITNLSKMKDGKMVMEVQGDKMREILGVNKDVKEVALENLTQAQATQLAEYQKAESEKTPEQIIRGQATNIENSTRDINYILRLLIVQSTKTAGKGLNAIAESLGVDIKDFSEATKKFRDEQSPKLMSGFSQANDFIDEKRNNIKTKKLELKGSDNSSSNKTEKLVSNDNQNKDNTLNINFKSDVNMGKLAGGLLEMPGWSQSIIEGMNPNQYNGPFNTIKRSV
jgi:hypothetical protein